MHNYIIKHSTVITIFFLVMMLLGMVVIAFGQTTPAQVERTWTAPADRNNGNTCVEYDIRFSKQLITESNFYQADRFTTTMTPAAPRQTENLTVTGLDEETIYYFAIKTRDIAGNWSDISNVVTDTTGDYSNPYSITDLF